AAAEEAGEGTDGEAPAGRLTAGEGREDDEEHEPDDVRPQHDRRGGGPARGDAAEEVADAVRGGGAEGEECGPGSPCVRWSGAGAGARAGGHGRHRRARPSSGGSVK